MKFRSIVANTPALVGHWQAGLRALAREHSARVDCRPTTRLRGSVSLDPILAASRPGAPSWDYAIGWESRSGSECVCFAEVHPANNEHVRAIIQKKRSVLTWIGQDAPALLQLAVKAETALNQPAFHWLATDSGVAIRKGSRQSRMLQEAGIDGPKRRLVLS